MPKKQSTRTLDERLSGGVFFGLAAKSEEILILGYVKEEAPDRWVAICVNMALVGQGHSREEAMKDIMKEVRAHVTFLRETYPDDWKDRVYIDSPREFMEEFLQTVDAMKELLTTKATRQTTKQRLGDALINSLGNGRFVFAEPVSTAFAQGCV